MQLHFKRRCCQINHDLALIRCPFKPCGCEASAEQAQNPNTRENDWNLASGHLKLASSRHDIQSSVPSLHFQQSEVRINKARLRGLKSKFSIQPLRFDSP